MYLNNYNNLVIKMVIYSTFVNNHNWKFGYA